MAYSILFLTVVAYISLGAVIEPIAACEIDPLLYTNSPLVLRTGRDTFLYPEYGETTLKFDEGEIVDLVCPGRRLVVLGQQTEEVVQATCISNARFRILGERTLWSQVSCAQDPVVSSRYTGRSCENGGRDAEVGFSLRDGRFLRTMQICYDPVNQSPFYSYYNLTASIGNNAKGTPRPSFYEDREFYSTGSQTVNQLYGRAVQRSTLNGLVGLSATSIKYVDNGNWLFLSRGHLTARADFYYPAQQNATFRYINAAPQWQSFNGLNWNEAEISTRNYADKRGLNLQVWTGVYGVTTLPHETTGRDVQLYLYVDSNGNTALPVPELYWKVVYDPVTARGIALIGLNNPYQTDVSKSILCTDVSGLVTWLSWNKNSINDGYSYACTVSDLRKVISYAPNLRLSGLLV